MKEVDDAVETSKGGVSTEDVVTAASDKNVKGDEINIEKTQNQQTDNKTTDGKEEQIANNPPTEVGDNKGEADKEEEPEAPTELENEKPAEKVVSTSEEKFEAVSVPTLVSEDSKQGAEKQPAEHEEHNETAPDEKDEKDANEAASKVDDAKDEEKPDEAKEDSLDKQAPNQKLANDGETKVSNDNPSYSVNHEKTSQEPKASQVSC